MRSVRRRVGWFTCHVWLAAGDQLRFAAECDGRKSPRGNSSCAVKTRATGRVTGRCLLPARLARSRRRRRRRRRRTVPSLRTVGNWFGVIVGAAGARRAPRRRRRVFGPGSFDSPAASTCDGTTKVIQQHTHTCRRCARKSLITSSTSVFFSHQYTLLCPYLGFLFIWPSYEPTQDLPVSLSLTTGFYGLRIWTMLDTLLWLQPHYNALYILVLVVVVMLQPVIYFFLTSIFSA